MVAGVKAAFLGSMLLPAPAPQNAPAVPALAALAAPGTVQPQAGQPAAHAAAEEPAAAALAESAESAMQAAPAKAPAPATLLESALALASSGSAQAATRLLGASVAYAAELPPVNPVTPPAPSVRPMLPPTAAERLARPDEAQPATPPAPQVAPYVSRDSAAQRQAELNRREQELLALQQQMDARMTELSGLENQIQGMIDSANTAQEGKLRQLVDMYANMKPRVAAQALTVLDEPIAVKILAGMKSKQSGEILSYMDPRHAARLSEALSKMQL